MRLHSNFHDYYDNAIGFGIDEKVYYNRITKQGRIFIKSRTNLPTHGKCGLLGFCGEIYPFVELDRYEWIRSSDNSRSEGRVVERYFAYSADEYVSKKNDWEHIHGLDYFDLARNLKLKQFFTDWRFQSNDIFREFRVPAWIYMFHKSKLNGVINPRLKDYGFDRIKDALTAFQEISMYLSNILVEQKEIAHIDDSLKVEQHGFDSRSFRKQKKT
jgi:hypothetical protein